jgi:hypothetical protein
LKSILAIEIPPVRLSFDLQRDASVLLIARNTEKEQSVSLFLQPQDLEKMVTALNSALSEAKASAACVEKED